MKGGKITLNNMPLDSTIRHKQTSKLLHGTLSGYADITLCVMRHFIIIPSKETSSTACIASPTLTYGITSIVVPETETSEMEQAERPLLSTFKLVPARGYHVTEWGLKIFSTCGVNFPNHLLRLSAQHQMLSDNQLHSVVWGDFSPSMNSLLEDLLSMCSSTTLDDTMGFSIKIFYGSCCQCCQLD